MKKTKIIQNQKEQLEKMANEIEGLKSQISYLKIENKAKLEQLLKDYDYAILVKDYKTQLWNDGRFEKRVRQLTFESDSLNLPILNIEK